LRRRVLARACHAAELGGNLRDIADADRRVHAANIDHPPVADPVQPGVAVQRLGAVQVQDKLAVGACQRLGIFPKLRRLPCLPLILAEVLDREGLDVFNAEEPLPGGVNGEASEVAGNPAPPQLFCDGGGCAGAAEAV